MDDDYIEWELNRMDGKQGSQPMETMLNRKYRPVDRDFAERIFKMFARPFDPNWQMPDLDGPEYRQPQRESRPEIWPQPGRDIGLSRGEPAARTLEYLIGRDDVDKPELLASTAEGRQGDGGKDGCLNWSVDPLGMFPQYDGMTSSGGMADRSGSESSADNRAQVRSTGTTAINPYAGGYANGGAEGDILFGVTGVTPMEGNKGSNGKAYPDLTDEQKLYLATVAGEAGGNSEKAQRAVAHVIMNRVGYKGSEGRDTIGEVLTPDQFESIDKQNIPFRRMTEYLKNRDGSDPDMERIINAAMNVYHGKEPDFTGGAVLFYSPEGDEDPPWPHIHKLDKLSFPGMENDNFRFFKYK